jgi:hypothetical protein
MLLYATTNLCVAHANGFHKFMNIMGHLRSIILYRVYAQTAWERHIGRPTISVWWVTVYRWREVHTCIHSLAYHAESRRQLNNSNSIDFMSAILIMKIIITILWRFARQRLAKHVSERYAVNGNICPLLDNGFGYHSITGISGTTQTWRVVMEPLRVVVLIRFSGVL